MTADSTPARPVDEAGIEALILTFVRDELLAGAATPSATDDLLSGELLDSMAVLRLATFVDETFDIGMKPADFRIENFQTVQALTRYVRSAAR